MTSDTRPPARSPLLTLVLLLLVAFLAMQLLESRRPRQTAAVAAGLPAALPASGAAPGTAEPSPPATRSLAPDERNTIAIYQRVSPSVVSVANKALIRSSGWFGSQLYEIPQGAGSGFVWDRQGHIISNYHVVHEADAITVTFADGATFDARLVGIAPDYDLAVLRIDAPVERLQPVAAGESRDLQVGQSVLAIGNPFGLDTTLTVGIVSALGRTITSMTERKIHDVIQTDAAINPGNSGGPLLNSSGRLIGINTAILSPSGAYAGVGFAVPVDTVARVVPQLIAKGRISRAGLGVQFLPDHVMRQAGVSGVALYEVYAGTPAANAGLTGVERTRRGALVLGDVIVAVDQKPVKELEDLRAALDLRQPGETVKLALIRGDQRRTIEFKLIELP
jgi:S1-C subfamily serine protease